MELQFRIQERFRETEIHVNYFEVILLPAHNTKLSFMNCSFQEGSLVYGTDFRFH